MLDKNDLNAIEKIVEKVIDKKLGTDRLNRDTAYYSDSLIELRKNFYTWLWNRNNSSSQ